MDVEALDEGSSAVVDGWVNTDEFVATIELNEAAGTDGGSGTVTGGDGGRGKGGLTKSDGENVTPEGRPEEAL